MKNSQLESFQINGVREFWSLPDVSDQCLDEAYALAKVIGSAFRTAGEVAALGTGAKVDTLNEMNDNLKASAMDGIARPIALAQYSHMEGAPR